MVRLFAFLSALVMASMSLWLAASGAESFLLVFQGHPLPKWFGHHLAVSISIWVSIFAGWVPIMIAMKSRRRRPDLDEDVSLTPRMRRLPSGLREL
jgi:hypothetical protein